MTNHAIVIGIDAYSVEEWRLGAAVNDALRFAKWVLESGRVEEKNLRLFLASEVAGVTPFGFEKATSRNLRKTLVDFQKGAGEGADRLYFYYAGHGLSAPGVTAGGVQEPVLIPADVESLEIDSNLLLGFSDLIPLFLNRGPREQFFFVDACRDFALEDFARPAGRVGPWSPEREDPGARAAQYLLYATSPGQQAYEKDRGMGIFGGLLMEGLAGHGVKPVWNPGQRSYEVRFTQLAGALRSRVREEIEKKKIAGWAKFAQLPQPLSLGGEANPVLATLREDEVGDLAIKVRLGPSKARKTCTVQVLEYLRGRRRDEVVDEVGPPAPLPARFELPPGDYSITAGAPGFESWREACDLSEPKEFDVRLEKAAEEPPTLSPRPTPSEPAAPPPGRWRGGFEIDEGPGRGLGDEVGDEEGLEAMDDELPLEVSPPVRERGLGLGGLDLSVDDPSALIVLRDSRREVVASAPGRLEARGLEPGLYRARLVFPEGAGEERIFEVRPGKKESIRLSSPAPTFGDDQQEMLSAAGISPGAEGTLHPSELLDGIAGARLVSLLSYGAFALTWREPDYFQRLRRLGLGPLPNRRPGGGPVVLVVVAANGEHPGGIDSREDFLAGVEVEALGPIRQVWDRGKIRILEGFEAAGQRIFAPAQGTIDLRIELPGLAPTHFALAALPDRLTALILSAHDNGEVEVQQLVMPFTGGRGYDRELLAERAIHVRIVEEAQRFLASGKAVPEALFEPILIGSKIDPLLGCMAGYAAMASGKKRRVERFSGGKDARGGGGGAKASALANLLELYPDLPDVHVLAGLGESSKRAVHFRRAMKKGVPVFSQGLKALASWTAERKKPPKEWTPEPSRGQVPGSLWSSWVVERPAIQVRNDTIGRPPLGWASLTKKRPEIERVLRSVCRIETPGSSSSPYMGTGFVVAPDLILTADYIGLGLAVEKGGGWRLRPELRARVDFREEAGASEALEFAVEEVVGIDHECHLALLRIAATGSSGAAAPPPLTLATGAPEPLRHREVYVVGYPAADARTDPKILERIFGDELQVKRLQPGVALRADEAKKRLFHDCFTLGGNGGSPLVDLEIGEILGLHYAATHQGGQGADRVEYKMGIAIALWMLGDNLLLSNAGATLG